MAQAVQELYPGTQVTIGPAIENGFYYDFARAEPFTPDDLEQIEARMHEIVKRDLPITREVMDREEAKRVFAGLGETYKVEIIEDIIPVGEEVSIYRQGDWFDVCRGPHLPSTGKLGEGFKLTKVAGAYWRGDSKNAQLQRIYGTAWRDKKELNAYLTRLEEAEKRDHRKLGKQLDLFHFQDEAPGMAFWHAKGRIIYRLAEQYMREKLAEYGYQEVETPQVLDRSLWERSGHWDKFAGGMFTTQLDEHDYAIKPMNCPGHIQLYNQGLKSYRDLPLRHRRVRGGAPLRALRHPARADARAPLHPGRRPHLLHRGPAPGRGGDPDRHGLRDLSGLRLRPDRAGPVAAPGQARRQRRALGQGRGGAGQGAARTRAWSSRSSRARAPSTAPRSSSPCTTASGGPGSAGPSRWTSPCPGGWVRTISPRTTASRPR